MNLAQASLLAVFALLISSSFAEQEFTDSGTGLRGLLQMDEATSNRRLITPRRKMMGAMKPKMMGAMKPKMMGAMKPKMMRAMKPPKPKSL